tara:strand:- start:7645 stop:9123 length:1479 start_codon:yes stop_codon:yes gene_type:complete
MNLLLTLLKAAHCRSTHHYFALDALPYVSNRRGKLFVNLLLKHHDQYLLGAKDPDTRFRDFRNHVLHVADNDWGGAPAASEKWYRQLIVQLDRQRWSEAAYAAGVLSHYFTDPLMPLHTAQSEIESVVHRPIEWSVNQSYSRILKRFQDGDLQVVFQLAEGQGWLSHAIKRAARVSHRHYAGLIRGYDLEIGVKRPALGFDEPTVELLAGLFGLAITGWAKVLERAANDSRSKLPTVSVTTATIAAAIKMPSAWITRRIENAEERRAIQRLFEEFRTTGQVVANLPDEVVSVRNEKEREKESNRASATQPMGSAATDTVAAECVVAASEQTQEITTDTPHRTPAPTARQSWLRLTSPIVDAPSIGPKTAIRFHKIGIDTIEQFLSQAPDSIASSLDTSWIDAERVLQWQDQARLVCDVPSLCGYKSQLLVGVGCRSQRCLSQQNASQLHVKISEYAATSAGKRALRSSRLPSVTDVSQWIRDAQPDSLQRTA